MLKTLQLYTICIVILVILVSQLTLFSNIAPKQASASENESNNVTKHKTILDEFENSQFGEPIKEIKNALFSVQETKKQMNTEAKRVQDMLDIEKNVNDMIKAIQ